MRLVEARRAAPALALLLGLLGAAPNVALAAPELIKGPYLMDVGPTSIAVLFELSEPAGATVVARSAAASEVRVEAAESAFQEVVLEGLEPRTAYDYRVMLPDGSASGGTFSTAPPPGEGPVEFLVMGDNRSDAAAHRAVVDAMLEQPADFLLNTGDMVADGSDSDDWAEMFEVQEPLLRSTPLFPTLGNHELYQSGRGLESFLRYTRVPRELGGGERYYAFTYGPLRFVVLDSNEGWGGDSEQRRWLEEQLAAASGDPRVEHIVVAMHHGPFSSGRHGGHRGMASSRLPDLLREHGVSLVLSGHDHAYERGYTEGVKYIVTGGGGAPLYSVNNRLPGQLAFEPAYHFLRVSVDGEQVMITAVRPDGSEIERCGFVDAGPWTCEGGHAEDPAVGPVHPGAHPAAFWAEQQLGKPTFWILAAGSLLTLGIVLITRRRSRRSRG